VVVHPPSAPPQGASNRFARLIPAQSIATVSEFTLESGVTLNNITVGFRTWGKLNQRFVHLLRPHSFTHQADLSHLVHSKDNVMVICHALTGSSDVEDWCISFFFLVFPGRQS
jgi:homoserine O-acetyltransferase